MEKNKNTPSGLVLSKAFGHGKDKIIFRFTANETIKAILCFVLQFSKVFSGMTPFGLAFYSAIFRPDRWIIYFITSLAGMIISHGEKFWVYAMSMVAQTTIFAIFDTRLRSFGIKSFVSSALFIVFGFTKLLNSNYISYDIFAIILEAVLLGVSSSVFAISVKTLDSIQKRSFISEYESLCIYASIAILILSMSGIVNSDTFNLSSIVSILLIMTICMTSAKASALIPAVLLGVIGALSPQSSYAVMGTYPFAAMLAQALKKYGKPGIVLGFIIANTAASLFLADSGEVVIGIYECFIASMLFALIPKKFIGYLEGFFSKTESYFSKNYHSTQVGYIGLEKISQVADSIGELSSIYKPKGNDQDNKKGDETCALISRQLAGISEIIKSECINAARARDTELEEKIWTELDSAGIMAKNVIVQKSDNFNFDINITMKDSAITKTSRIAIRECIESVMHCKASFAGMRKSDNEITFAFCPAATYSAAFGYATKAKSGEKVCGDSFNVIYTDRNRMVMALSDGMGSGSKASAESKITVELLEKFLTAGFDCDTAVNLINSSLLMQGSKETFATMDICDINLASSTLSFTKLGAADAYIKASGKIKKIKGKDLPVGILDEAKAQRHMLPIDSDTVVVLMSDGISDISLRNSSLDGWIEHELLRLNVTNPQIIAGKLIEKAGKLSGGNIHDDMTVLVGCITRSDSIGI